MVATTTYLYLLADFSREDPERVARAVSATRHPSLKGFPTQSQAEIIACMAYIEAANRHAKRLIKEKLRIALVMRGLSSPGDQWLGYLYDQAIGTFFSIDFFREGSCRCECARKNSHHVRNLILAALFYFGVKGFEASDLGESIFSEIAEGIDQSATFFGEVFSSAEQELPFVAARTIDQFRCEVSICLPEERRY